MKKVLSLLLTLILILSVFCSCGNNPKNKTPEVIDRGENVTGLFVTKNGEVCLGGKSFTGFGINMFSTFHYHLFNYGSDKKDNINKDMVISEAYKYDFAFCNEYNIPVVRIPFSAWAQDAYRIFENDREKFFAAMDDIVAEAEKCHVGIIASLMWTPAAMPKYLGERRADMGNPESKTIAFMKEYVGAIVSRYKDSPAIWGWEVGNEYNLSADLCDPSFKNWLPDSSMRYPDSNGFDYFTTDEMDLFYEETAKVIKSIDPDRFITSGNGSTPTYSYHKYLAGLDKDEETHVWSVNWTDDTKIEFEQIMRLYNPSCFNTVCFHFQHATNGSKEPSYYTEFAYGDEKVSTAEYLKMLSELARKNGQAAFYGEFGDFRDMENMKNNTFEDFCAKFTDVLTAIDDSGIQVACGWFNWSKGRNDRFDHTSYKLSEINKFKMDELKRFNDSFVESGRQDIETYWSKYPCDGSSFINK